MSLRRRGFTVLELLVALTIMAMIAAALASTTSLGSRVWQRASAYPEADAHIVLRSRLRHWLETAKPPARVIGRRQEFVGTPDRIAFLTSARVPGGATGSEARITLALAEGGAALARLTLTIDWLDAEGAVLVTDTRVLVEQVEEATIRYFRQAPDSGGVWQDRWQEPDRLPDLVSIEVKSQGVAWPPLVVAPKLD